MYNVILLLLKQLNRIHPHIYMQIPHTHIHAHTHTHSVKKAVSERISSQVSTVVLSGRWNVRREL